MEADPAFSTPIYEEPGRCGRAFLFFGKQRQQNGVGDLTGHDMSDDRYYAFPGGKYAGPIRCTTASLS
jgi:hypothetical protein